MTVTLRTPIWADVPTLVDAWVEKTAAAAWDVRRYTGTFFTRGDLGFYWEPELGQVGVFGRLSPTRQDFALAKQAAVAAVGRDSVRDEFLSFEEVSQGPWIKIAYSKTLRRLGELLNFFPGKYPGGLPNAPSPLAATLTSGLIGAGLGYGVGWLGERVLPASWQQGRLRRTLALLGGGIASAPGLAWSISNLRRGKGVLDPSPLNVEPGTRPDFHPEESPSDFGAPTESLSGVPLSDRFTGATERFAKRAFDTFAAPWAHRDERPPDSIAVNVNQLGQVLWESNAGPRTMAATMGAMYAAGQLPDPASEPGFVTPHQTGLLGTMMGAAGGGLKGYAAGWLAGEALGLLTGMPPATQSMLKNTGAIVGVVNAVVPRLFGR